MLSFSSVHVFDAAVRHGACSLHHSLETGLCGGGLCPEIGSCHTDLQYQSSEDMTVDGVGVPHDLYNWIESYISEDQFFAHRNHLSRQLCDL